MDNTNESGGSSTNAVFRPFYMCAVRDALERGEPQEIQALLDGAKEVKSSYGDLDGVISQLEQALSSRGPNRHFYMVAVREAIARGNPSEIQELLQGVREAKTAYGDFDSLIRDLEQASGGNTQ